MAANKITYDQAVATIQAMFGSEIERDTIITLLQANRGHVEKTIDDILAMSAAGSPTVAVPSQSAASAQHPASTTVVEVEDTFVGQSSRKSVPGSEDFSILSLDNLSREEAAAIAAKQAQLEADEQLARRLQHQLYVQAQQAEPTIRARAEEDPDEVSKAIAGIGEAIGSGWKQVTSFFASAASSASSSNGSSAQQQQQPKGNANGYQTLNMVPEEDDSLLIRRNRRDEEEQGEEMRTFKQDNEKAPLSETSPPPPHENKTTSEA